MMIPPIAAALRVRRRRELVEQLRAGGALSPTAATGLTPSSGMGRSALRDLLRHRAVLQTENGSYWLDEAAYVEMLAMRRRVIALTMTIVFFAAAIVIAATLAFVSMRQNTV
jgi:hypothetical protein